MAAWRSGARSGCVGGASAGEPGRWFAAAKDAGFLELALEFAKMGRTDPRTLSRASRDLLQKDVRFSLEAGHRGEPLASGHHFGRRI